MTRRLDTPGHGGRAALALEAYAAQVREAVAKALDALDQASAQMAEWAGKAGPSRAAQGRRSAGESGRGRFT